MMRALSNLNPQTLRIIALLVVLALVILFFSTQISNYLNGRLFNRISSSVAIMALIATAQTLVILTRNIDLSVGSVVGFTAFATGSLIAAVPDLHPLLLVSYAMVIGACFGAFNGFFVAYARVPAIIVTLATLALFRSLLVEFADGRSITSSQLPQWLTSFPNTRLFEIGDFQFRASFVVAVVIVLAVHIALQRLRVARKLYAIGSNPEAAEMAGINQKATVFVAFVCAGGAGGPCRVHVSCSVWQHHRGCRPWLRAQVGRRCRGRRRQHFWRIRHGVWRTDRCGARGFDRDQSCALAAGFRVLARGGSRRLDPDGRRH
jgi:rhamnose transport system permease protein